MSGTESSAAISLMTSASRGDSSVAPTRARCRPSGQRLVHRRGILGGAQQQHAGRQIVTGRPSQHGQAVEVGHPVIQERHAGRCSRMATSAVRPSPTSATT